MPEPTVIALLAVGGGMSLVRHYKYRRPNTSRSRGFDEMRRSTALMQIGIIYRMGYFTESEVQRFSLETQQYIARFMDALGA